MAKMLGAATPLSLASAVIAAALGLALPPSSANPPPAPAGPSGRPTAAPVPCAERLYNGICLPREWPPHRAAFGAKEWPYAVQTPPYLASPPALIDLTLGRQVPALPFSPQRPQRLR